MTPREGTEAPGAVEPPRSLLGDLRASFADEAGAKSVEIELPGFKATKLVVRYAWRAQEEIAKVAEKHKRIRPPARQGKLIAMDTLAMCCDEILVRREDSDELTTLAAELGDATEPVRFDARLCEALGLPAPTKENPTRSVVLAVFKDNDHAITRTFVELSRWLADTSREVGEGVLGE